MTVPNARDRLAAALARIDDPAGEGSRACLTVYRDEARRAADAADARAASGRALGPLDGAIVSIKDLFDVAGEVTRAGSRLLADEEPPAAADALVVRRLRAAGAVIVAKTNMTEFAFSGVGINPHYGTPANPADRSRIPGGSTSGGAVAVADGMCEIAIGSDTGGSTRIPAALCGIVGFKPSASRISTAGAFPLSRTLDSIGPMGSSVAACAAADAIMAGQMPEPVAARALKNIRVLAADGVVLSRLDPQVDRAFHDALDALIRAGLNVQRGPLPHLDAMNAVNAQGGLVPAEAIVVHRSRFPRARDRIDPFIATRFDRALTITPETAEKLLRERAALVRAMDADLAPWDVVMMPTTPVVAPTIADMEQADTFARGNALLLRNTSIGNFFDLCAISLPLPRRSGELPCGLMLLARHGRDRDLFAIAAAVEKHLC